MVFADHVFHNGQAGLQLESFLPFPGPGIGFGVVESEVNLEGLLVHAADALRDAQRFRVRMARLGKPLWIQYLLPQELY